MGALGNFLVISRAKVQTVSFASATLGIFLGADSFNEVLSWDVLVYVLLFYTLITFACNINCFFDVNVDKLRKRELAAATLHFGKTRMGVILFSEALMAILLSLFLLFYGHWEVALLSLLGLYFGWAYSSPPLRIKGKGAIGPLPIVLGVYVLPIVAGYLLVDKVLTFTFLGFVAGYAIMNLGINLVNTCEDFSEDRKLGIRTIAHTLGLRSTLDLAFFSTLLGGALAMLCLLGRGYDIIIISFPGSSLAILFFATSVMTVFMTSKEILVVGQAHDLERSAKKHAIKMPKWFVITRYPMWLFALTLLFL
ncbi:MAG: UbiA family prenyltransferase [Thermoplasmata archaeon]|nr:MAG: UbiA family prenyltransferase [Thermoplasmata archaeon]